MSEDVSISAYIEGYSRNRYIVSSCGRIYSCPNRVHNGKWLKPAMRKGYLFVTLCSDDGKVINASIHRQVALAFINNPNSYDQINHKDGNKLNNRVDNLEWCNAHQNKIHAYKFGLIKTTENMRIARRKSIAIARQGLRKLSDSSVLEIRSLHKAGFSSQKIAPKFNVSPRSVRDVINGISYKEVL